MSSPNLLKVLDFIVEFKRSHDGNSPCNREIADGCGIASTSTVDYYLRRLEASGLIERGGVRMIRVAGGAWALTGEPSQ